MMKAQAFFFALLFIGCSRESMTKAELENYMWSTESGLVQQVNKSDIRFEMGYKPKDLVLMQLLDGVKNQREINEIKSSTDSLDYFILRLSRSGEEIENNYAGNSEAFNGVINYLSFNIAPDLYLITEGDTVLATDALYSRSFGSAVSTSVMAVFKSNLIKNKQDAKVYFNDTHFGTGLSEFEFKNKNLQHIPNLKTN